MGDTDTLTLPENTTIQRQCRIEEAFDPGFIELLKLVPRNPHVRALILKFTGKMPGPECETFEQIKDWVEFNCRQCLRKPAGRPARDREADGIAINVDFSETEYGRADYSLPRSGSDEFRIGAGDLLAIIQETIADGDGLNELVDAIASQIDGDARNQCDPNMEDSGDYDYSDHEATDSDNGEIDYSREEIRNAVLRFVRERHPELAAEL